MLEDMPVLPCFCSNIHNLMTKKVHGFEQLALLELGRSVRAPHPGLRRSGTVGAGYAGTTRYLAWRVGSMLVTVLIGAAAVFFAMKAAPGRPGAGGPRRERHPGGGGGLPPAL